MEAFDYTREGTKLKGIEIINFHIIKCLSGFQKDNKSFYFDFVFFNDREIQVMSE